MNDFKDLTGDPLYDHFKQHLAEGINLVGAQIIEHKIFSPTTPRKEIIVAVTDGKIVETFKYNYNKLWGN